MLSGEATAFRLRREIGAPDEAPLSLTSELPRLYGVSFHTLSSLSVSALKSWAEAHAPPLVPALAICRDRRLRGGALAMREHGVIFADEDDSADERALTFAHEACHFLRDHCYPRQDAIAQLGGAIRPVLDGLRTPTADEEIRALLQRAQIVVQVHLLDRDASLSREIAEIAAAEAEADAFAYEALAPMAALARRFPRVVDCAEDVGRVYAALVSEFRLPPSAARQWALTYVGRHARGNPLGRQLGLF